MALFNGDWFPYTNYHELNLDWLVAKVKEYMLKVEALDTDVDLLGEDFEALKKYVTDYFDSLDIKQAVSEKLDEMLDDGELAAIISQNIFDYSGIGGEYGGRPLFRTRVPYWYGNNSGRTAGFQNMTVYNPQNAYGYNDQTYIYTIKTWSDDVDTELVTIDPLTNAIINSQTIAGLGHGGCMAVKDTTLYLINFSTHELFEFDITTPRAPVLRSTRTVAGNGVHIIGFYDGAWYVADSNRNVYLYDETFSDAGTLAYTLNSKVNGVLQDYALDPVKMLIYKLDYNPNMITVFSLITGEVVSSMSIPRHLSYVSIGECEGIFAYGDNVYLSSILTAGTQPGIKLDFCIFHCDLMDKDQQYRHTWNQNTLRYAYVNYAQNSGLNPISQRNSFKYIEDAINCAGDINQCNVYLQAEYPESFTIFQDCGVYFNSYPCGAFKVAEHVDTWLSGLPQSFLGSPIAYRMSTWMHCGVGSNVKIRTMPGNEALGSADMILWAQQCTLEILTESRLHDAFLEYCDFTGPVIISNNVYLNQTACHVKGVDLAQGNTQFFSDRVLIRGRGLVAGNDRFYIDLLPNYDIPGQGTFLPSTGAAIGYQALAPLEVYKASDGSANIGIGVCNGGANTVYNLTLTRSSGTFPESTYGFTWYKWKVGTRSGTTLPQLIGVFNFGA